MDLSSTFNGYHSHTIFKSNALYPLPVVGLDFQRSNTVQPRAACFECFAQPKHNGHANFVDLFEFPHFGGMPYPIVPGAPPPRRWAADLRYTWNTPLPHAYPNVRDDVLKGERVRDIIDDEASISSLSIATAKARRFYFEIRATLNRFVCKICGYVLFKVFRRLMSRLQVNPAQMRAVQEAEKTGVPLVYLPLHRSHLDYLLITWNSWHFGLRLPHIASGDNLNLSGFGWLLRATGAFFIRRRLDPSDDSGKDIMYRTVLRSYIEEVLKKDLPIEFFLEGTRSRFGKALIPKNGLISNVVEAVQQGKILDVYLVPVSYTYDRVAEGVFLEELMGYPKTRESLWHVFRSIWSSFGVSERCGTVRMHYGRPMLLSEYLYSLSSSPLVFSDHRPKQLTRLPESFSYRELVPWAQTQMSVTENRLLIRSIGFHIVYEAQEICSTTPVSILAALLLTKYRNGGSSADLAADMHWLAKLIVRHGGDVVGWKTGSTRGDDLLKYAMPYLKECLIDSDRLILPVLSHRQLVNLAYAKNALLHRFCLQAVLATAILSMDFKQPLLFDAVIERALIICNWMNNEVVFVKPCQSLRERLRETLGPKCLADPHCGCICIESEEEGFEAGDQGQTVHIRAQLQADQLVFYANFIRPFLQTMQLVLARLHAAFEPVKELDFSRQLIQSTLANESSNFKFQLVLEAVNSDSIKNCIRTLRDRELVTKEGEPVRALDPNGITAALREVDDLLVIAGLSHH